MIADREEEWGMPEWTRTVEAHGFLGDHDHLWESIVNARQTSGFGLDAPALAADKEKANAFCAAVRDNFGHSLSDELILAALLKMPRNCAWCPNECWIWCETCGGCNMCCVEDYHCKDHGSPFGVCHCPESNYRDSDGKPPEESPKITVTESVSSVGNQVFSFRLANGRRLEIEFCPHLVNLEGAPNIAAASLFDESGERLKIGVAESGSERTMMRLPCLWCTTPEEDRANSEVTGAVLGALRDEAIKQFPGLQGGDGNSQEKS